VVDMVDGVFLLMCDNSITQRLNLKSSTIETDLSFLHCIILSKQSLTKHGKLVKQFF